MNPYSGENLKTASLPLNEEKKVYNSIINGFSPSMGCIIKVRV